MCAQSVTSADQQRAAIARGKNVLVSTFDRNLPKVTLAAFLRSVAEGPIEWETNDCGEQTGNPAVDRGREFPICVEAMCKLRDGRKANVSVAVGTTGKGLSGKPELAYVLIQDKDGAARNARLSDLAVSSRK